MPLEQDIQQLTQAVLALTQVMQEQSTAPLSIPPVTSTAGAPQTNPTTVTSSATASSVQAAHVQPAAVTASPTAAVQPAAVSLGEVAQEEVAPAQGDEHFTLDTLKAEATRIHKALNGDPRIGEIIAQYGSSLSTIDPANYGNVINALRGLMQ